MCLSFSMDYKKLLLLLKYIKGLVQDHSGSSSKSKDCMSEWHVSVDCMSELSGLFYCMNNHKDVSSAWVKDINYGVDDRINVGKGECNAVGLCSA